MYGLLTSIDTWEEQLKCEHLLYTKTSTKLATYIRQIFLVYSCVSKVTMHAKSYIFTFTFISSLYILFLYFLACHPYIFQILHCHLMIKRPATSTLLVEAVGSWKIGICSRFCPPCLCATEIAPSWANARLPIMVASPILRTLYITWQWEQG